MGNSGRRFFVFVFVASQVSFGLSACRPRYAAAPPLPPPDRTPVFSYAFKDTGSPAEKSGISVALVRPRWPVPVVNDAPTAAFQSAPNLLAVGNTVGKYNDLFARSVASDLEQLLTARGFTFSGPFDSLDEMTFPQKKQSDLVLVPEIAVKVTTPQVNIAVERASPSALSVTLNNSGTGGGTGFGYLYSAAGFCTASGFVAFQVYEPLSAQKLWLKKVPVEGVSAPCYVSETKDAKLVETLIGNGVAGVLERIYPVVLGKAATYFVREELEMVKKQSTELREKKVY